MSICFIFIFIFFPLVCFKVCISTYFSKKKKVGISISSLITEYAFFKKKKKIKLVGI